MYQVTEETTGHGRLFKLRRGLGTAFVTYHPPTGLFRHYDASMAPVALTAEKATEREAAVTELMKAKQYPRIER